LHTFIVSRTAANAFDLAQVFRNVMVPGPGPNFDFTTNAITLAQGTATASNNGSLAWNSTTRLITPDGARGVVGRTPNNTNATKTTWWMPASTLLSGEYNETSDVTGGSADFEEVIGIWFGNVGTPRTIPFPSAIDFNYTQLSPAGVNPVLFSATGTVPASLNQLIAMSLSQTAGGVARTINFFQSGAFNNNASTFNLNLPPYPTTWIPPSYGLQTGSPVNFIVELGGSTQTNGIFTLPTSNQTNSFAGRTKVTTPN
jgi:hypothetical protein